MSKDHLKRLAAPRTWNIQRKGIPFITKSLAGTHSLDNGMPISVLIKETLKYASTTKEVKKILNTNEIKIDGKRRKNFRFSVGLFDTIEFTNINEHYRVILNKKGTLALIKINKNESSIKPCKIIGITMLRGRMQLNLYDGRNILIDKGPYKVGDTLLLSTPDNKITKLLKLGKKSAIFLTGGKHIGEIGNVDDIVENKVIYKNQKGDLIETSRRYAFVVGEDKPAIALG